MKRLIKGLLLLISFLSVIGLIYYLQIRFFSPGTLSKQPNIRYTNTPTVFIHGYEGSSFSFGPLLRNLERQNVAKRELTIVVDSAGKLQVEGKLRNTHDNPTIMVLFEKDSQSEITQSKWIDRVMRYLEKQGVHSVNLVAHSMGGVSLLRYLLEYANPQTEPVVEKVVTIAAPFNDLEIAEDTEDVFAYELTQNGPSGYTPIYQYFDRSMNRLPQKLRVLNVAGDLKDGSESDGSVSVHSAFSLRYLLEKHTKSYQEYLVTGKSGGHSVITRSLPFQKRLIQFLWQK